MHDPWLCLSPQHRPVSAIPAAADADGDGGLPPHPGAFPAIAHNSSAAAAAVAIRLPGLDSALSRSFTPSAAAVPDLNAIPEDGVLASGPLPPPAGGAAAVDPLANAGGGPPLEHTAGGMPVRSPAEGQAVPDRPAEQQAELPMANGYLPNPGADMPAQATEDSTAAAGEGGQPPSAASAAAAEPAAQPGSGLNSAAEAHPSSDDPKSASVATNGAAAPKGSPAERAAQDAPQRTAPAIAAQQPGSAAEQGGAGTVAAAEAGIMAVADRAVAVEEAMEVRQSGTAGVDEMCRFLADRFAVLTLHLHIYAWMRCIVSPCFCK